MKRIIVIAPHPDDELIGCGGTLLKHKYESDRIFVVYCTTGEVRLSDETDYLERVSIRKAEAEKACKESGFECLHWTDIPARELEKSSFELKKELIQIFQYLKPHVVFIPHKNEKDSDHVLINAIAKEAYWLSKVITESGKRNTTVSDVLAYEVWSPMKEYHRAVNITQFMEEKMKLINHYESQVIDLDYATGTRGLNEYRGNFSGSGEFAEVFFKESF